MRNIVKSLMIVIGCMIAAIVSAQTTVTWIPTQADVTALTNTSIHYVDVGTGTNIFRIYSTRPFFNTNEVKLAWDASANAVKMTDNGIDKAGLAIYVPGTSDAIESIVVYMHTSNSRKTLYADDQTCPSSGTATAQALAQTPSPYSFWTGNLKKEWYYAFGGRSGGSGESFYDKIEVTFAGEPPASTDASLSALSYNGTSVPNFSSTTYSYDVELPAGTTAIPTVAAVKNDTKASDPVITQATHLPGSASVSVTAEDGTTKQTYTINFTVASSAPKVLTATWANIQGTAVVDNVNMTITGQVKHGSSLTSILPNFTGNNIDHWTPNDAQNFSSPVNYIFFNANTETTQYTVTITEAPDISSDATLSTLTYGGQSVPNFSAETYAYNIQLASGTSSAPTVAATANESHATVSVTQATSVPGAASVLVTAQDGTTKLTYTINFTVPVPPSGLTTHEPGKYEADKLDGGYGGDLSIFGNREYEVYYCTYDSSNNLSVAITPKQKTTGITNSISTYNCKAKDGWFELKTSTSKSNYNLSSDLDEFKKGDFAVHKLLNNGSYKWKIRGYDQFSFYAAENSGSGKYIKVLVDDIEQQMTKSTSATIRRFDITTGEHVIEIIGVGSSNEEVYGFSFRVAQEPRVKYLDGNDSTQEVLQTTAPQPIYYYTKYNSLGETRLLWSGTEATGFTLSSIGSDGIGDTLALSGTASCPVGEYHYFIKTYYNHQETSSVQGKIKVTSMIKAKGATTCEAYQNEAIDDIRFTYYALDANDVTLSWENNKVPDGITGQGANGTYTISGIPTQVDTFVYTVSVLGGNSITDTIIVNKLDLGNNPILYLYKNDKAYNRDGMYKYLSSSDGGFNLIPRKALENGKRADEQYAKYKWVLISEDVDANNKEVLAVARGESGLPVLSMKAFSYAPTRLDWGEPDNGSLTENGQYITVQRNDHPIFQVFNKQRGERIRVLDTVAGKGLMPIDVNYTGTLCLATALTRNINDYHADGPEQTFLHEVQQEMHAGKKYICFPIGMEGSHHLTSDGKRLIKECIKYITGTEASIKLPDLAITEFKIGSYIGQIDDERNLITVDVQEADSDLVKAAKPQIALASPMTFVKPMHQAEDGTVDFTNWAIGVQYVVSDYINKRYYDVLVNIMAPQGFEDIEIGEWINIFDIYGRKVATTNEDFRTMDLPHGMYIIVSASGKTLKIMR